MEMEAQVMGEPGNRIDAEKAPSFEEHKAMLRPNGIINGVIQVDEDKCIGCGLCVENCAVKNLEMDEEKIPKMKSDYLCSSCFNCIIACPEEALSFSRCYGVEDGFFDVGNPPVKMPLKPKDADGNPDEWTPTEKIIMERRSVRNFKRDPVPEPLITRILEAGRFAPSGGNHQPWQFTVVTDPAFIVELETACQKVWAKEYKVFANDDTVATMVNKVPTGVFEPRTQRGLRGVALKDLPVFFHAPCIIFMGANQKLNDPATAIGICGENMNLVAASLGLGVCWSNFGRAVNFIPEIRSKLGFDDPWLVMTVLAVGYSKFKQVGIVARQYRPVTWYRPGVKGPQFDE
jgi:nitroreductase/NAD-dependent dihydropyrimidine dehydrogenase PreA subunit